MATYNWSQSIATGGSAASARQITLRGTQETNDSALTSTITVKYIDIYSTGGNGVTFYLDGKILVNGTVVYTSTSSPVKDSMKLTSNTTTTLAITATPVTINHSANGAASFTVQMAKNSFSAFFWVNDSYTSSQWTASSTTYTVTATSITVYRTVSYNKNGGSGSMNSHSVVYGGSHTVQSNSFTPPTGTSNTYTITLKSNYTGGSDSSKTVTNTTPKKFSTWRQGSTSGTERKPGTIISNITSNITLYAIWVDDTLQKGTIVLGELTRSAGSVTGYEVSFDTQGGSSVASITSTRKVTYTHDGWMTSANGTSISYDKTTSYSFTADIELFAKWSETYTNNSIKLPDAPTKLGYKFLGWGTSTNATSYKQPGESITPSAKTTYYAIWKADGSIRIYTDDTKKYQIAMVWMYYPTSSTDSKPWKLVIPYMKTSSNWKITAG